jgi:uncharacterized Tic20 family protein
MRRSYLWLLVVSSILLIVRIAISYLRFNNGHMPTLSGLFVVLFSIAAPLSVSVFALSVLVIACIKRKESNIWVGISFFVVIAFQAAYLFSKLLA